jgi:hypothetical protein
MLASGSRCGKPLLSLAKDGSTIRRADRPDMVAGLFYS